MNMKNHFLLLLTTISMAFFLPMNSAFAGKYYQCQSGYTFQSKNGGVRCFKAAGYKYKSPVSCPIKSIKVFGKTYSIGTTYRIDWNGSNKDMCVGKIPVGGPNKNITQEVVCPVGYIKQKKPGKDKCRKQKSAEITFPNKQVNK